MKRIIISATVKHYNGIIELYILVGKREYKYLLASEYIVEQIRELLYKRNYKPAFKLIKENQLKENLNE